MKELLITLIWFYVLVNIMSAGVAIKAMINSDEFRFDDKLYLFIFDNIWMKEDWNIFGKLFMSVIVGLLVPGVLIIPGLFKLFNWLFHIGVKRCKNE